MKENRTEKERNEEDSKSNDDAVTVYTESEFPGEEEFENMQIMDFEDEIESKEPTGSKEAIFTQEEVKEKLEKFDGKNQDDEEQDQDEDNCPVRYHIWFIHLWFTIYILLLVRNFLSYKFVSDIDTIIKKSAIFNKIYHPWKQKKKNQLDLYSTKD